MEYNMEGRVAYCILAHDAGEQLTLLIDRLLSDQRSSVYLHLDGKAALPVNLAARLKTFGVTLVERVRVNWGGYSMVQATRHLLNKALADERNQLVVLLSGSCFPLRAMDVVNDSLLAGGDSFALWDIIATPDGMVRHSAGAVVEKRYFMDIEWLNPSRGKLRRAAFALTKAMNRRLPYRRRPPLPVVRGSQWFVVSSATARSVLKGAGSAERFFEGSFAPDETFYQSLYSAVVGDRSPAFIFQHATVQGRHFIPFRSSQQRSWWDRLSQRVDQRTATSADVSEALSTNALFIRKCSMERCQEILRQQ